MRGLHVALLWQIILMCNVPVLRFFMTLVWYLFSLIIIIIIIITTLFQEDNIFGRVASLTYGPQLTNVGMIL